MQRAELHLLEPTVAALTKELAMELNVEPNFTIFTQNRPVSERGRSQQGWKVGA